MRKCHKIHLKYQLLINESPKNLLKITKTLRKTRWRRVKLITSNFEMFTQINLDHFTSKWEQSGVRIYIEEVYKSQYELYTSCQCCFCCCFCCYVVFFSLIQVIKYFVRIINCHLLTISQIFNKSSQHYRLPPTIYLRYREYL